MRQRERERERERESGEDIRLPFRNVVPQRARLHEHRDHVRLCLGFRTYASLAVALTKHERGDKASMLIKIKS